MPTSHTLVDHEDHLYLVWQCISFLYIHPFILVGGWMDGSSGPLVYNETNH